jgi:UDP-N-acetylmuramyl pentapeptide phosphotransferase/UDP-N-acetylglucosamine-1-phosphate transferase
MLMYFVTPVVIQVVKLRRLFEPVSNRSSHGQNVPSFGGITFFIVLILALNISEQFFVTSRAVFLVPSSLFIFFMGLKDDLTGISPWNKIIVQLIATTILFLSPDFQITNLHGFLGIHEIAPWICIPLAFLVVVFYINAYNLIDGIDGLASGLGALFFTFFSVVYFTLNDFMMMAVCLAMVGSFVAFLRFNISKDKRIFLGDTGSLLIGFLIAAIVINIMSKDYQQEVWMNNAANLPLLIISALYIPVFDSIRVFIIRIQNGKSPFVSDRSHIHHVILDHFKISHRKTAFILVSLNALILFIMGFVTDFCNHKTSISVLIFITVVLAVVLHKVRMKLQNNLV